MMNQMEKVLNHIQKYGYITTYDAFKKYNITRLSAKIFDLINKKGINVKSKYRVNRKTKAAYKVYYLKEKELALYE